MKILGFEIRYVGKGGIKNCVSDDRISLTTKPNSSVDKLAKKPPPKPKYSTGVVCEITKKPCPISTPPQPCRRLTEHEIDKIFIVEK